MAGFNFANTAPLATVRNINANLSPAERQLITNQILVALRDYYVHLPLKESSLAIDPLQEVRLLNDDLPSIKSDSEFFRRVLQIFTKLRDRHTVFALPAPWANMVAFVPFAVEVCWDGNDRLLLVSKVSMPTSNPDFVPGVKITHWNGVPIGTHVVNLGELTAGSNPFARVALALRSLTARSLGYTLPPDEDWVTVTFVGKNGIDSVVLPWMVYFQPFSTSTAPTTKAGRADTFVGLDTNLSILNTAWSNLFAATADQKPGTTAAVPPEMADKYTWSTVATNRGQVAYLRIFSFEEEDPEQFLAPLQKLLKTVPMGGLVVDIRANPGGNIPCGEGLLQLLCPHPIEPEQVSFRISSSTKTLANAVDFFADWRPSLGLVFETGEIFTQGYPVTDPALLQKFATTYTGPVCLIVDALSYSTSDFFSCGFRDNGIGPIIGVDPVTGAGGANVWKQSLLAQFATASGIPDVIPLPRGASMNVAVRRSTRVGKSFGIPVEGLGVTPNEYYYLTRRDVLSANEDMLEFAAERLYQIRTKAQAA